MENHTRVRRQKRQRRGSMITNIVMCIIALAALTVCIFLILNNYALKKDKEAAIAQLGEYKEHSENYVYTQADLDNCLEEARADAQEEGKESILAELKSKMSGGGSAIAMLRDFFPGEVVVYVDGGYHFFAIDDSLKQHSYVYDNFITQENGQIEYVDDTNQVQSLKGIDVSKYQEEINWQKVAQDGVSYAFIRAGVRGSTEGRLMEDDRFYENIKGALENGIQVGAYFFTQAITEEEAIEEAKMVLDMLEPYDVTYPVVYDLEEVTSNNARTIDLTKEQYTKNCIAFCETIQNAGYTPMIYGNLKTFFLMLDMTQLEDYKKWFAYYNTPVYFPYAFDIWQYSSEGSVNGIDGDVDLNISMTDFGADQDP